MASTPSSLLEDMNSHLVSSCLKSKYPFLELMVLELLYSNALEANVNLHLIWTYEILASY